MKYTINYFGVNVTMSYDSLHVYMEAQEGYEHITVKDNKEPDNRECRYRICYYDKVEEVSFNLLSAILDGLKDTEFAMSLIITVVKSTGYDKNFEILKGGFKK